MDQSLTIEKRKMFEEVDDHQPLNLASAEIETRYS